MTLTQRELTQRILRANAALLDLRDAARDMVQPELAACALACAERLNQELAALHGAQAVAS